MTNTDKIGRSPAQVPGGNTAKQLKELQDAVAAIKTTTETMMATMATMATKKDLEAMATKKDLEAMATRLDSLERSRDVFEMAPSHPTQRRHVFREVRDGNSSVSGPIYRY